jgi:hypothetical protein
VARCRWRDMSGAVGKIPSDEPRHARWLAAQCAARPDLIASVESVIRDPYGRRDVQPLCTWQDWHRGLQYLEKALRRGSDTFTAGDYCEASRLLSAEGHPFAGPLWTLGSYVDDVASYRQSWGQRYASRARTADELEAAQLIADGHVRAPDGASWAGVDGARYALAVRRKPGSPGWRPVVIVENSAECTELVPFQAERAAGAWMQNRVRGTGGPLRTSKTGPACRASLEDEVLAWLVHAAHDGQPWDLLGQVAWTSHLRAELYAASESHGKGSASTDPGGSPLRRIRSSFTYWLAFAPGWAADDIGWPDARHARAYLNRLAVTPVSEVQALCAAQALARADTEAAARAGAATPTVAVAVTEVPARRFMPNGRRRAVEPRTQRGQHAAGQRGMQPPQRPTQPQARHAGPEPR